MRRGPMRAHVQEDPLLRQVSVWFSDADPGMLDASFYYPEADGTWTARQYPHTEQPPPSIVLPIEAYQSLMAGGRPAISINELEDTRNVRNRLLAMVEKVIDATNPTEQ